MALRQYIGARYVPIFDGDWDNTKQYEPLTIVNYSGDSYTSKTIVPAGADIHNTTYWACTGNYNAQVETYRQLVVNLKNAVGDNDDLNTTDKSTIVNAINEVLADAVSIANAIGDIDDLTTSDKTSIVNAINEVNARTSADRRYIVVSDSYGLVRGGNTPFTETLQSLLDASNDDFYNYSEGSMGFNATGDMSHTALTLLQAHENDVTDHDTITDIIFAMGANDAYHPTGLGTAITNCVNYAKATYPNARIYLAYIGNFYPKNGTLVKDYALTLNDYIQYSESLGCFYIKDVEYVMHNFAFMQADGVHPTTAGCDALAGYIYQFLISGSGSGYKNYKVSTFTSSYGSGSCTQIIDNGTAFINILFNFTADFTVGATLTELATIDSRLIEGCPGFIPPTDAYVYDQTQLEYVPIKVFVYNGKVYAQKVSYHDTVVALANTSFQSAASLSLPTIMC